MSLPYDPAVALDVLRADPPLASLIEQVGPFRLELRSMISPFQALMSSIIYQQLSGKAAATIQRRVHALFPGDEPPNPDEILAVEEEALRGAGMSRAKVAAVKDLAAKALDGVVPARHRLSQMNNDEIITRLTTVRGIGRWTVEMLLIYTLERSDILPADDFGVRDGYRRLKHLETAPTRKQMNEIGRAWSPYRTVAAWYLWRMPAK